LDTTDSTRAAGTSILYCYLWNVSNLHDCEGSILNLRAVLILVEAAVRGVGRRRSGAHLLLQRGRRVLPPQTPGQDAVHPLVEHPGYEAGGNQGAGHAQERSGEEVLDSGLRAIDTTAH